VFTDSTCLGYLLAKYGGPMVELEGEGETEKVL
jgi:hypothetical protein